MNREANNLGLMTVAAGLVAWFGLAQAGEAPHWGYSGAAGPENWAGLSPAYGACDGKNQSPIDSAGFTEVELEPIGFAYQVGGREVPNNGHRVQVSYAAGSSIAVDGRTFALEQLHFHAPSENQIEGRSFPLEGHLVHADADGNLAVVAVMFTEWAANQALRRIWAEMPQQAGEMRRLANPVAAADLLPADRDHYRFNGSLTTPPCTEGVRWLVMKRPVSASAEQMEKFARTLGRPNNRPIQPTNARLVLQ